MTLCPICGERNVVERSTSKSLERNGRTLSIDDFQSSFCTACESVFVNGPQAKHNKISFRAAEKKSLGLLTGAQVKAARNRLKLTQAQAAQIFGGGANAFSKYENEEVTQSEAMDKLLRLVISFPQALQYLIVESGATVEGRAGEPAWQDALSTTEFRPPDYVDAIAANDNWHDARMA